MLRINGENQMIRFSIILALMFSVAAHAQMPEVGDFYYVISPRKALVGQQVRFEANVFSGCQRYYTTTYSIEPTPISSRPTFILRLKSTTGEGCGPALGYSGPIVIFENLKVGVYKIQFDSTSEFKKELGGHEFIRNCFWDRNPKQQNGNGTSWNYPKK
jgi:hypothetical protein